MVDDDQPVGNDSHVEVGPGNLSEDPQHPSDAQESENPSCPEDAQLVSTASDLEVESGHLSENSRLAADAQESVKTPFPEDVGNTFGSDLDVEA